MPLIGYGGKTGSEMLKGKDLSGQTAVVTGAKSGIGLEITRVLALAGCRVVMAVRKQASGEFAAKNLRESLPHGIQVGEVVVRQCNLASFGEIRAFAAWLKDQPYEVDYMVLNAAIKGTPKWYTREGHELQMGVNFIGHFHLVQRMLPQLQAQQDDVRIVAVVCKDQMDTTLRMTDINFSKVNYDGAKAYKGSKIALALFAKELAVRTEGTNISVFAADPGPTGGTMIDKYSPMFFGRAFSASFLKSVAQGAATPIFALVAPLASETGSKRRSLRGGSGGIKSGSLLVDCKVNTSVKIYHSTYQAKRIWEEAEQLVDRSVIGCHVANAGMGKEEQWVMAFILRPLMDFLLRMFGMRRY